MFDSLNDSNPCPDRGEPLNFDNTAMSLPPTGGRIQLVFSTRLITDINDPAKHQFIEVYRSAFSGAPYYENFSATDVEENVWKLHIKNQQCILVAEVQMENGSKVAAVACAHAVMSPLEPSIREFLTNQASNGTRPYSPTSTMFISELATSADFRGKGLGTQLTVELLRWGERQGFTHWATRTAAQGSNSLRIFQRCGGEIFASQDVSDSPIESASKQRVYLAGNLGGFSGPA
jgi:hypothetical protein